MSYFTNEYSVNLNKQNEILEITNLLIHNRSFFIDFEEVFVKSCIDKDKNVLLRKKNSRTSIKESNINNINQEKGINYYKIPMNNQNNVNLDNINSENLLNIENQLLEKLVKLDSDDVDKNDELKRSREIAYKPVNACPHKDKPHYAKNMCNNCYHSRGRNKPAWKCNHTDRPHYARGVRQNCYQKLNPRKKF